MQGATGTQEHGTQHSIGAQNARAQIHDQEQRKDTSRRAHEQEQHKDTSRRAERRSTVAQEHEKAKPEEPKANHVYKTKHTNTENNLGKHF